MFQQLARSAVPKASDLQADARSAYGAIAGRVTERPACRESTDPIRRSLMAWINSAQSSRRQIPRFIVLDVAAPERTKAEVVLAFDRAIVEA